LAALDKTQNIISSDDGVMTIMLVDQRVTAEECDCKRNVPRHLFLNAAVSIGGASPPAIIRLHDEYSAS
jgi:hypothetical protein